MAARRANTAGRGRHLDRDPAGDASQIERLTHDISQRGSRNLLSPLTSDGQPAELAPIAEAVASLLTRALARHWMRSGRLRPAAPTNYECRSLGLGSNQQLAIELGDQPAGRRLREVEFSLSAWRNCPKSCCSSRLDAGFAQAESASIFSRLCVWWCGTSRWHRGRSHGWHCRLRKDLGPRRPDQP